MPKRRVIAWFAAAVLAVLAVWGVPRAWALSHVGAGYAAQQTCACLFVSHRALESCRSDLEPLARRVVSFAPGPERVTARALWFAEATAHYQEGFGCALVGQPPAR
jgi:hypothetical protein